MAKKPKLERVTSAAGVAQYPRFIKPDEYKGKKFFKTNLIVDPEDETNAAIVARVNELATEKFEEVKAEILEKANTAPKKKKAKAQIDSIEVNFPWEDEVDDEGEETGNLIFKMKKNSEFEDSDGETVYTKVHHFDAGGNALKNPPNVWGGSTIKTSFDLYPYYNPSSKMVGVSLRLQGVQILDLVTGGAPTAEAMGFGAEQGYTQSADVDDAAADDSDDGTEDDF